MLGGRTHHEVIEISSDDDDYDDDDAEEVLHHQQQVGAGSCKTEPSSMATSFLQVHGEEDEEDEDAARHKLQQPSPDAERRSSPYYLANFMLMVESVRRLHGHLLTPEEEHLLHVFAEMGEGPKRLYVRLFQRKGPWFRPSTLDYPEIDIDAAAFELRRSGFCEALDGVKDCHVSPGLLSTLSKYQLQAILRAAQATFLTSIGKKASTSGGMRVGDLIQAITSAAGSRGSMQQTLDGRSALSKLVERELRSVVPCTEVTAPSASRSDVSPFCAIRLAQPTLDLFKRMQRLFFLNDSQDMTLFVLVGMDKVKYPTYICPNVDIHAWKRNNIRHYQHSSSDVEEGVAAQPFRRMEPNVAVAQSPALIQVEDPEKRAGDESFSTPPPSPCSQRREDSRKGACECYWWRRQGSSESRVFPSRAAFDLYERALALAGNLGSTDVCRETTATTSTTTSATSPTRSDAGDGVATPTKKKRRVSDDCALPAEKRDLEEWLSIGASFLAHSASSPVLDPYSEIIRLEQKQQLAARSRRKRFSSADAFSESSFPSILQQLSSLLLIPSSQDAGSQSATSPASSLPLQPLFSSLVPTSPAPPFPFQRAPMLHESSTHARDDAKVASLCFPSLLQWQPNCSCQCASAEVWRAWVAERPFLSRFTHGWVLARMLHDGTALLEKQKKYAEAAACLRLLLSTPFCPGKRGHWWNRLSLNVEHMGHKKHSLILAETALSRDNHSLRLCDQLILQKRVLKLAKPPLRWTRPSFLSPSSAFSIASLKKPRTSTIYGRLVREQAKSGKKSTFIGYDGKHCTVEELALQYYAQKGEGWAGMHSENGIFKTLFGILMWDVLFADIPGVFMTPFQVAPLDLPTDAFSASRRELIEHKLHEIQVQPLTDLLETAWIHHGTQCLGVDWRYHLSHLQVVASCLGGTALATIFRLLAEDYKGWGHGLPDLLLWNEDAGTAKLVEVKGPRDRLSAYQQVWIDQLLAAGVECELCYVLEYQEPVLNQKRKLPH